MRIPVVHVLGALAFGFLGSIAPCAFADTPGAPTAPATDAKSVIAALIAEIDAAEKDKDDAKMSAGAKKAATAYKSTADQAIRGPLLKQLVALAKQTKYASARRAALQAIVETDDAKEGTKALMSIYPKDDVDDTERFNCDIVKAIGAFHADVAIDPLIETFKKAKQIELAVEAATALGNYHKSKQRERVLEELYKAGKNMVPSRGGSKAVSPDVQAKWGQIAGPLGKAFDTLTGDSIGAIEEWLKKINEAKDLKKLFKD